jgi:hypothetical protein
VLDVAPASPAERAGCTPATALWGSMGKPFRRPYPSIALPRPKFPPRCGARFLHRESDTILVAMPRLATWARRGKAWDVPSAVSDEAGLLCPAHAGMPWVGSALWAGRGNANYRGSEIGENCGGRNTQNVNALRARLPTAAAPGFVLRPYAFEFFPAILSHLGGLGNGQSDLQFGALSSASQFELAATLPHAFLHAGDADANL